jgi:hypothetical protein
MQRTHLRLGQPFSHRPTPHASRRKKRKKKEKKRKRDQPTHPVFSDPLNTE